MAADSIYSATYSGVPVFEYITEGNQVMRRRQDQWINATQILKVANYDKPARTRVLERSIQKGDHEKVQGGYGKYQGTWVPLELGKQLAKEVGVLEMLLPIFDYVPGNVSPPPAPKHTTNASKPRQQKAPPIKRIPKPKVPQAYSQISEDYDNMSTQLHDDESMDNSTVASASFMEEDDSYGNHAPSSRKRKRGQENLIDQQHTLYADELLDYFMLSASDPPLRAVPPEMPANFQVNRPIDDQDHTALHWASSMGDLNIVRKLLDGGANSLVRNKRGETPLIRAVLFTNNYEKSSMLKLVHLLLPTLKAMDLHNATILHHIAMTTNSLAKKRCARYYLDTVLHKLAECCTPGEFTNFVNHQDHNGDTALHIVARHNAKKCIRSLQGRGVRGDILNNQGESADDIIYKTRSMHNDFLSSSPVPGSSNLVDGKDVPKTNNLAQCRSHSARSFTQTLESMTQDRGLQMVLAFEGEVREKDDDLTEGQRIQQQVENERQQVRVATFKHIQDGADDISEKEEARLRQEALELATVSESLSEQIQHKDLHHAVRSEEHHLPPIAHQKSNGAVSDSAALEEQGFSALLLAGEQSKRRKLTSTIVEAQGAAGMSQHGEKLKKLVSSTTGVPAAEVAGLAPELLDELQQSKMETGIDGSAYLG